METITVKTDDGRTFDIGVAVNFAADGAPVFDLAGNVDPRNCDHAGACYSDNMALLCPKCGAPMFLPGRLLANKPFEVIEAMHELWHAAGCPPYFSGHWSIVPEHWTVVQQPLFGELGGLPVLTRRLADFQAKCAAYLVA